MTRHGAGTVEDDHPDESNLQTFSFTSQPKCCKKCDFPEPLCHECCGKYQFERDMAIRTDERKKILEICTREKKKLKFDCGIMSDDFYNNGILWMINKIEEELRREGKVEK